MNSTEIIQNLAVTALPLLFAVTVHEASHGLAARYMGDPTAERAGRLTLNPLRHIDLLGTIVVPLVLLFAGGFIFGWAKPVPVDPRHFRNPRRDMALVAFAGPFSNFVMACLWALAAKIGLSLVGSFDWFAVPLVLMGKVGIFLNLILMVLNLLPLPPLDGGRVAVGLLPRAAALGLARVEPYGMYLLLALLFTGVLGKIIGPPIFALERLFYGLVGL